MTGSVTTIFDSPLRRLWLRRFTVVMFAAVCVSCSSEAIKANLLDQLAREIVPASGVKREQLVIIANPKGEGLIVFAYGGGLDPALTWLCLNGRFYALGESSQAATPELPPLSRAPSAAIENSGLGEESTVEAEVTSIIRAHVR